MKRALNTGQIVIEDPGTQLQMFSTRTLESEPIPLDVKVILLGTPWLYYELYRARRRLSRLFKVKADFASEMERTPENERAYALFVRARCAEHDLPPFDAGAVAQPSSSMVRGWRKIRQKLSTQFGDIADLIIEAAHWARKADRAVVTRRRCAPRAGRVALSIESDRARDAANRSSTARSRLQVDGRSGRPDQRPDR